MLELQSPRDAGVTKKPTLLILIWAFIYLIGCNYPPALLDDADTVHAEAAREMATTGDWVTLHANQIRYLEKAPFMYWLVAFCYKVFGVNEFTTRLPIALATLALVLAVYSFGRYFFNHRAGFYSALVLATSAGLYLFTRVLWPDVILTLWISLTLYCFLRANEDPAGNIRYVYGIYAFSALAVLTKGLIGMVFPGAIILVYLAITRQLRQILQLKLLSGTSLFLLIAAPWHLLAGFRNKGFFYFYFINEHFLRYVGKRYPVDYDTVPLLLFIGLHLVWLFPWSFFLALAPKSFPKILQPQSRQDKAVLLILIWIVIVILFFCFSTRQEYYTMPTYPAFALLIGFCLAKAEGATERKWIVRLQGAIAILGILIFAAGAIALYLSRGVKTSGDIASALGRNPQEYALSLGHMLDLTPESISYLRIPILGTALSFLIGTAAAFYFRLKRRDASANIALGILMVFFFYCAHLALIVFEPYLSSKNLSQAIGQHYKDGEMIILNGEYEGGSSINFYMRKPVYILNGRSANLEFGSYFEDAPKLFLTDADMLRLWSGEKRVYFFSQSEDLEKLNRLLNGPAYRLAESGGKVILSNRP